MGKLPADKTAMVEVSAYPLRDDYIAAIDDLIDQLSGCDHLEVTTNRMSTLVFGPYRHLMECLTLAMERNSVQFGTISYVVKVLPKAERELNGYR
tara:strand:+ start:3662 stop:3946 length:285 start_codon:yes stop_codon:yes gene_type:complete